METLPQILEEDADEEISMLYDEIKNETESPVVNYIWRHLATIDGAAQWAWEFTKINENSKLSDELKIFADNSACTIIQNEGTCLKSLLKEDSRDIIESYNKNNIENLVRVTILLSAIKDIDISSNGHDFTKQKKRDNLPKTSNIKKIPRYDSLDDEEKNIIDALSSAGPSGDNGIIPTLWVHLSTQHGLLQDIRNPITDVLASTAFETEYQLLREIVVDKIKLHKLCVPPPRKSFDIHQTYDGLTRFSKTIAELSLIGRVINQLSISDSHN